MRRQPAVPVGYAMHTYADLRLPPDVEPGIYPLVLSRLEDEGRPVTLGEVEVSGRPRRFDVPALDLPVHATFGDQVTLLGTNTEPLLEVVSGQAITVTLAWQTQATPSQDLVRFVHLLNAEGLPVAQQDSRPCDGECPASSWLPGEVLLENFQLQTPAGLPPGAYRLAVGWYDAATVQRLTALDAAGLSTPDNLLILPIEVRMK